MLYCYNVFVFLLQTVLHNTTEVCGNNESMGNGLPSLQNAVLIVSLRCSVAMYVCVTPVSVHPVVLGSSPLSLFFRLQVASKFMPVSSLIIGEWVWREACVCVCVFGTDSRCDAVVLLSGVDLVPIRPIPNVVMLQEDITTEKCRQVRFIDFIS